MKAAIALVALFLFSATAQATQYVATYRGIGTSGDLAGQAITLSFEFTDAVGGTCCNPDYFERNGSGSSNPVELVRGAIADRPFAIDFRGRGSGSVAQYDLSGMGTSLGDWLLHHARIDGLYYFNVNLRAEFVEAASPDERLKEFDYSFQSTDESYGLLSDLSSTGFGVGYFRASHVSVRRIDAAVPEPAGWAMLLVGFFALGGAIRSRGGLPHLAASRRVYTLKRNSSTSPSWT